MLSLLAALTLTASPAIPAKFPQEYRGADLRTPKCDQNRVVHAQNGVSLYRKGDPGKFSPLGELPDAKREYAVMRMVEGCMVPAPVGFHPAPVRPADGPENRR